MGGNIIKIGDLYIDRDEIAAILPRDGRETLIFLRSGKSISVDVQLSEEDLRRLMAIMDGNQES